jgi:hypothetical protein
MYDTDYLIVGAGAIGMNCADVLLDETDADILIVDRHSTAGGHWNDAYPFVRLHQPSVYYGVPSRKLGRNQIDLSGSNKGYFELPTGAEVSAYFEQVMRERFLTSGRVRFLPMREFDEDRSFLRKLLSGEVEQVKVKRKIIDTTYFGTAVPSCHTPKYEVASEVSLITPNDLPRVASAKGGFTVVGGGKTAMDTCVWLLEHGAFADQIRWIVPRDSWLINRAVTQPSDDFFYKNLGGYAALLEAAAYGQDVDDIFSRLETCSYMLRIDTSVTPTMYRNATISEGEVDVLRQIKEVVRMGRVVRISSNMIELEHGSIDADPDSLYIDCTAKAFSNRSTEPIFSPGKIFPQVVLNGSVCMSAATIAFVEANYDDDDVKNDICTPIPLMDKVEDWVPMIYWHLRNVERRSTEQELGRWMRANRLTGFGKPNGTKESPDPEYLEIIKRIKDATPIAYKNLEELMNGAKP